VDGFLEEVKVLGVIIWADRVWTESISSCIVVGALVNVSQGLSPMGEGLVEREGESIQVAGVGLGGGVMICVG